MAADSFMPKRSRKNWWTGSFTTVHAKPEGECQFPKIGKGWKEVWTEKHKADDHHELRLHAGGAAEVLPFADRCGFDQVLPRPMQNAHALKARFAALILFTSERFRGQATAQLNPQRPDAAVILHRMEKLDVVGSVLYIAAHPDDENTKLVNAWLANGKKVRTGYLSLTRGDGGQDLLGPELGDALGVISAPRN